MSDPHHDRTTVPIASGAASAGPAAAGAPVSETLGQYRIVRLIGEGGMGAVYEAEQARPRRTVALKVIRPGMASHEMLARFEHEAEVLGRLQHAGIAQIHEAGTVATESGPRPFFAMELVRGLPLTRFAAERRLGTRERLDLVVKICDAVSHAHQKGVIHRDLKPGNILVTAEGQPKVLDFGVARLTESDIQTTTLRTDIGQVIGTVPYMSPEQASGDPAQLDTRSDVYALGVICYELLSGRLPHDLSRRMIHEAIRIIREEEPTRLSSLDASLRGDVDTIVAKALEKPRERRYQSAAELGGDIRRYLAHEPITARPATTWYQVARFSRRHRALVGGVVVSFLLLIAGITGTGMALDRALDAEQTQSSLRGQADLARQDAEASAALATRESAKHRSVSDFLREMLASANRGEKDGNSGVTVREIAADAARRLMSGTDRYEPAVAAAVARTIGEAYLAMGMIDSAEPLLRMGVEKASQSLGESDPETVGCMGTLALALRDKQDFDGAVAVARRVRDLARGMQGEHVEMVTGPCILGLCLSAQGGYEEAEAVFREAIETCRRLYGERSVYMAIATNDLANLMASRGHMTEAVALMRQAVDIHRQSGEPLGGAVVTSECNLGVHLLKLGRLDEAAQVLPECVEEARRLWGDVHPTLATALNNHALLLLESGQVAEAEARFKETVEVRRRLNPAGSAETAKALVNLGSAMLQLGRAPEAEQVLMESVEMARRLVGDSHEIFGHAIGNLGGAHFQLGALDLAESETKDAIRILRNTVGGNNPELAIHMQGLVAILKLRQRYPEAEAVAREALDIHRRTSLDGSVAAAAALDTLGNVLKHQRRFDEAEPLLREALEMRRRYVAEDHPSIGNSLHNLAGLYADRGDAVEAEGLFRQSLDFCMRTKPPDHPDTLITMSYYATVLLDLKKDTEAEGILTDCLERRRRVNPPGHWMIAVVEGMLAESILRQGRFSEAEPLLLEAWNAPDPPSGARGKAVTAERLARLYEFWDAAEPGTGRGERAREWRATLEALKK